MSKRFMILLLTFVVLLVLAVSYVLVGLEAYASYEKGIMEGMIHCGGEPPVRVCVRVPPAVFSAFYPTYVARHYAIFVVEYSSSTPVTLLVHVDIPSFSQVQMRTVNASSTVQTISFIPPLKGHVLRTLTSEDYTWLHVWVTDTQGHSYYMNDTPLLLHSRWLMSWAAVNRLMIAAWVTPRDPAVTELVTKAIKYLPAEPTPAPKAMIGYDEDGGGRAGDEAVVAGAGWGASSGRDEAGPGPRGMERLVADQVDAIYDAMRIDYQIQYVQASVPYGGPSDGVADTQVIKLPSEVLQSHSGMCVELTALLASAVESIGLDAEIVIIPGHAFLGVAVTPDDEQFEYWDAVLVNNDVAGSSANNFTDGVYNQDVKQHSILDTILIDDARKADVGPMV
jgi:hypothetical protein